MRRALIAANWKMNGRRTEIDLLLDGILRGLEDIQGFEGRCEVAIFPPSLYLAQVQEKLGASGLSLGAQNVYMADHGAFTGEISAPMLKDFASEYVLVGHSERRELFAENNELLAQKFKVIQQHELIPVLCVGESQQQRDAAETESVILEQLQAIVDHAGIEAFGQAVVAYEPVWAIGTGLTASPKQAQEVHQMIRAYFASNDKRMAEELRIIYGGSVKADNAEELFLEKDIDGALVGGASLVAEDFLAICKAMNTARS